MTQDGSGDDTKGGQTPNMNDLAGRYMDLWQKQVSGMAGDPKLAEAMSKTMAFMADAARKAGAGDFSGMQGMPGLQGMPGAMGMGHTDHETATTDGPATAQPASNPASDRDTGLADRVDALENRITVLESALGSLLGAMRSHGTDGPDDGSR